GERDDSSDRPTSHARQRECEQIKDEAHLREVADGKGEGRVETDTAAEPSAEVLVGAHADDVAKEGNDYGTDESEDANEEDAGDEQRPVARVGRARVGDEGDASDDRREQREAHRPPRNRAARYEILLGGALTPRETQADGDEACEVSGDDDEIERTHVEPGLSRYGMLKTIAGHDDGHANGGLHVGRAGDVLAGDIERGAVVDRGGQNGDAEGHVHSRFKVEELHGDVPLVVIHRDDEIVRAVRGAKEDGVGRDWTFAVDPACAAGFDRGKNEALVFPAEEPVLAGVRVEAANSDSRLRLAEKLHGLVTKLNGADDAGGVEIAGFAQADVRGDMHDAESLA